LTPQDYEGWYETPRGRWTGAVEQALLDALLAPEPGASLLDIGCGTGHFTRAFARSRPGRAVGLDPDRAWLAYAARRAEHGERYVAGRAEALPFADASFDYAVSVTALCFVPDQARALREMLRVTRRRFALGLLNRHSLLWRDKGRGGGAGAYRGAHWHSAAELRALFAPLAVRGLRLRAAVVLPGGGAFARALERCWPQRLLLGGFLAVAGEVRQ
jgi:SAM-dependent methyltransferase